MVYIKASEPSAVRRRVYFQLVDSVDGLASETGEAGGQPQVSVNGAGWSDVGIGPLAYIGNGRYFADLSQAVVATVGDTIITRYKSANTAECVGETARVVAFDPYYTPPNAVDGPSADSTCIETVELDVGETKRVTASIATTVGTLTIQGTPTVQLLDRNGAQCYGIDGDPVTGNDAGALAQVRAWFDLNTLAPPTGGPIVAGRYTLCFSITILKSTGGTEVRIVKVPIRISPLA